MFKSILLAEGDLREGISHSHSIYKALNKLGEVEQLSPAVIKPEDISGYDLIVMHGQRGRLKEVLDHHKDKTPVLVYDFGWIDRENNYQLCLGGLNKPYFGFNKTAKLAIDNVREEGYDLTKDHVFFNQMPNDAQHGMSAQDLTNMVLEWKQNLLNQGVEENDIYQQPHPLDKTNLVPGIKVWGDNFWCNIKKAYTYNSTVCIDLLCYRVPFEVLDVNSIYRKVNQNDVGSIINFFNTLTGNQFSKEELEDAEIYKKLIKLHANPDVDLNNTIVPTTLRKPVSLRDQLKAKLEIPEPAPIAEEVAPVEELEDLEIRMNNDEAQKWYEENKHLKFMALKKKVIALTGVTPKNGSDVIGVLNTYFTSL